MKTPVPPLQPGSTPGTFRVAGWRVFRPGFHKGQLYTPADCVATVRNFGLLSTGDEPVLRVKAKFGHWWSGSSIQATSAASFPERPYPSLRPPRLNSRSSGPAGVVDSRHRSHP